MRSRYILALVPVALLVIAGAFTVGWESPPMKTVQYGFRGLGMEQVVNPRTERELRSYVEAEMPEAEDEADPDGPRASSEYKNVKVLGDLSVEEFNRTMAAITEWVSPEEGCGYCHNLQNLASDEKYTKVVARQMIEMTRHINGNWKAHVADTGVTCYTCHRGNPVPANIWFNIDGERTSGYAASPMNQNIAASSVGVTSLPYDFFGKFLEKPDAQGIRVVGANALPIVGASGQTIQATEATYALMMHISQSLGVNCTFCHNSRAFSKWDESSKSRVTAWHGLQMVRDLNNKHLVPLTGVFPPERLGPGGDVPKLNCATCHAGVNKPLYGASMLEDYPELAGE